MFTGSMTALVTPMKPDGSVDDDALVALVERQIKGGIDVLVPCGTTGESATLSAAEQAHVVRVVVGAAAGRVPVVAGAGSSSTATAIALGRAAKEAGASGLLAVTPYYNKPSQAGMIAHFLAIAEVGLPIILYNVPPRTGIDLLPDAIVELARHPLMVGLKEATGSVPRTQQLLARLGDRLPILSGDDVINLPLYAVGARGCISVVSNVAPKIVADGYRAAAAGRHDEARRLHAQVTDLAEVLFAEPNPVPAKAALALQGYMGNHVRLPLLAAQPATIERLRAAIAKHGLT